MREKLSKVLNYIVQLWLLEQFAKKKKNSNTANSRNLFHHRIALPLIKIKFFAILINVFKIDGIT